MSYSLYRGSGTKSEMNSMWSARSRWSEKFPSASDVCEKIVDIFYENNAEPMSVETLMRGLKQIKVEPLIACFGEVGLLRILKEERPRILHKLQIDEHNGVVYYNVIASSSTERGTLELPEIGKVSIHDQLEFIINISTTMENAIDKVIFYNDTEDRREKMEKIALAVLQHEPRVFTLDRVDEEGTISRIETPEEKEQKARILAKRAELDQYKQSLNAEDCE